MKVRRRFIIRGKMIVFVLLLMFFLFPVSLQAEEVSSEIDIEKLEEEMNGLDEDTDLPDFSSVFHALKNADFKEVLSVSARWLTETIIHEIASSRILIAELVGVVIFSAIFSSLSGSLERYSVGDSGFMISYFIIFSIIFSNFTVMASLFKKTVVLLSNLIKIILPVYTLAVSLGGNLSAGVAFYEYFMVLVLLINQMLVNLVMPLIEYYLLLELLGNFTAKPNISKLCESLYLFLFRGMKLVYFLFFGAHLLETMIAPSLDLAKSSMIGRVTGLIPGGSLVQTVTGTVIGSSLLIKNVMGAASVLFLLFVLAVPFIKILLYVLFYLLLAILLEPVADKRFVRCFTAAQKSGLLFVYFLGMTATLFILIIAVTAMATNHV